MTIVILCGGAGTRLWPASRPERPKQFVRLLEGPTLFQRAVLRNLPLADRFLVISNRLHLDLAREQFASVAGEASPPASFLLEPAGRNTAPAVALAALHTSIAAGSGELMLIVPSDHEVADEAAYREAVGRACGAARQGSLVTFGIRPESPETGYGYIEAGNPVDGAPGALAVRAFHEKPARGKAEAYVAAGNFLWNSGMFVFSAGSVLREFALHSPDILEASKVAIASAVSVAGVAYAIRAEDMARIPADSIDYAVMEKSGRVAVIPVSMGWNDLGSFDAVYEASSRDADGNVLPADALALDSENCLVLAPDLKVRLSGVSDLVVVQDGDRLLIVRRGATQSVKDMAAADKAAADRAAG